MHTKTMEGLVGARTNMDLLNTPFRVYKDARRRGDTATMERAMGYVAECEKRADEYRETAADGMKEDAETAREKAKKEREQAIQRRREEREKLEERIAESRDENSEMDTLEVSGEGKALLKENAGTCPNESESIDLDYAVSTNANTGGEPVIYTKTGEASPSDQAAGISVFV